MISGKIEIPEDVEEAFAGLPDEVVREALYEAIQDANGPGGIMDQHWQDGQSEWNDVGEDYQKRKGDQPKFVNTGDARDAMTNRSSRYRHVRVSKQRKNGGWKASIALSKRVDGRNVYALAQAGKAGRGAMLVSANFSGDESIMQPRLIEALNALLQKRGLIE